MAAIGCIAAEEPLVCWMYQPQASLDLTRYVLESGPFCGGGSVSPPKIWFHGLMRVHTRPNDILIVFTVFCSSDGFDQQTDTDRGTSVTLGCIKYWCMCTAVWPNMTEIRLPPAVMVVFVVGLCCLLLFNGVGEHWFVVYVMRILLWIIIITGNKQELVVIP